jgi:phosphoserine phosphatase
MPANLQFLTPNITAFKPEALFFDMDTTVITTESIVEMAREIGKEAEVDRITQESLAGKLDFTASLLARLKLFAGASSEIFEIVRKHQALNPGMEELAAACRQQRVPMFLISGGFNQLAKDVCDKLGFSGYMANELEIKDGKFTGQVLGDIVDAPKKASWVTEICKMRQLNLDHIVTLGDGANDIDMMKIAGLAVGFTPKPALRPYLDIAIDTPDYKPFAQWLFAAK